MAQGVELAAVGVELIPGIAGADNITIGTSTITGGVSGRFLYDNSGVIGEYLASATSQASSVVLRDVNSNSYANNFVSAAQSTVSGGTTTTLTVASARIQILTGSSAQTFQLPDATTLTIGTTFQFNNNSSQPLTVNNNGGSSVVVVAAGSLAFVNCLSISTANGAWDSHLMSPSNVTWTTSSLRLNNTTPIVAGGAAAFLAFSTANFGIFMGSGVPTVSAAKGSIYIRSDGSTTNDRLYVNTNGSTTWTAVTTVA